jgi:hypothetical protein
MWKRVRDTPSIEFYLHVCLSERNSGWAATDNTTNTPSMGFTIGCNLEVVPEHISGRLHLCSHKRTMLSVSIFSILVLIKCQSCASSRFRSHLLEYHKNCGMEMNDEIDTDSQL